MYLLPLGGSRDLCSCAHHRSLHKDIALRCRLENDVGQAHSLCRKGTRTLQSRHGVY